jgi:hypothetical protein
MVNDSIAYVNLTRLHLTQIWLNSLTVVPCLVACVRFLFKMVRSIVNLIQHFVLPPTKYYDFIMLVAVVANSVKIRDELPWLRNNR